MLGESADVVATLVDDLADGIWLLDPLSSTVLDVNATGTASLGRGSEVRGSRFSELGVPARG